MTYLQKWHDFSSHDDWSERTTNLFKMIPNQTSSILELGCGKNNLRTLGLINSENVKYISSDITCGNEVDLVLDLNGYQLPEISVETIFFSGLLEYIYDVPRFLNWTRMSSNTLVGSYATLLTSPLEIQESIRRSGNGWKNHMSLERLHALSLSCGWSLEFQGKFQEQVLFVGHRI